MISRISDMRKRRNQGGFTLIELLVVIIILGVLSAVVVFAVRGTGDKGRAAAIGIDARTVRTAEESFCAKFGRYGSGQELVDEKFLSEKTSYSAVHTVSGGTCKGSGDLTRSGYSIAPAASTAVEVAANRDQWVVSDTGSGAGYNSSAFAYPLNSNIYDPLIIMTSTYGLDPGLALSWTPIPTSDTVTKPIRPYPNTTWRFTLRQGVKFSDGTDFDADDVIWTWRDRTPLNQSPLSTVSGTLGFTLPYYGTFPSAPRAPGADKDSVEKIDQFTVDFTPKVENLRLPEQIVHPKGAIVPMTGFAPPGDVQPSACSAPCTPIARTVGKHFDGSTGGNPVTGTPLAPRSSTNVPVGTGPFIYKSYTPDVNSTTVANTAYWGPGPQVAEMRYTFITDPATRTSGVLSGEYDLAIDLDPQSVASVTGQGQRVVTAAYGQNQLIYVNKVVKYGPGDTPKYDLGTQASIRKAVSLAIDRATYVSGVYAGNAALGRWMAPPNILGPSQTIVPAMAYDTGLAGSTLAADGWVCAGSSAPACNAGEIRQKAGRALQLRLIGSPDIPLTGYLQLQANMLAVGIDLQFTRYATNALRGTAYNTTLWDLDLELPNQNDANPAFLPVLRMACFNQSSAFRFAPVDGVNGIGPSSADGTNGRYPFGRLPCNAAGVGTPANTTGATLGDFDNIYVPASNSATTQAAAQAAAANQMRILVGQNETNVVIPVVGQFRIYGMRSNVNLTDPHPSQTSQRWVSLTKT